MASDSPISTAYQPLRYGAGFMRIETYTTHVLDFSRPYPACTRCGTVRYFKDSPLGACVAETEVADLPPGVTASDEVYEDIPF